jgi:hypothetical protein
MTHRAARSFWRSYRQLSKTVQKLADKNFQLLKADPYHPSIHLKTVGKYWSARVGAQHRALAIEVDQDLIWFWIGTHAEYNAIIKR